MAIRYCGPGGNDGSSGLTWALRKLTLNGVEDSPVVAGDTVFVGPGVYREQLTVDVPGAAGSRIPYIGDVTGEHTDRVGGIVRITGSDDDESYIRNTCISADGKDWRTFRGFSLDTAGGTHLSTFYSDHWIVEDTVFQGTAGHISVVNALGEVGVPPAWSVRRCLFLFTASDSISFTIEEEDTPENAGHLVENCLFMNAVEGTQIRFDGPGESFVRSCTVLGGKRGVLASCNVPGEAVYVYDSLLVANSVALQSPVLGDLIENYNSFYANTTDRTLVAVGAHSETLPPLLLPPLLHPGVDQISGFKLPWWFGSLSKWSQVRALTGESVRVVDLHGIARPVTAVKNSWGSVQFQGMRREAVTTRAGSPASMCLSDAGRHQLWVPVTNEETTISVYVYREANYFGPNPQLIVKQPGQADDITTDAAVASQWNLLTTTLTPAADPPYVIVELVSRNTAIAGSFNTFFDDLVVD